MGVLGGVIWTAVALLVVGLAVYAMYRVSLRSEKQRAERRAQADMWGVGAAGAVGAGGVFGVGGGGEGDGGAEGGGDGGGGGCGGGGCGGGGCGGG